MSDEYIQMWELKSSLYTGGKMILSLGSQRWKIIMHITAWRTDITVSVNKEKRWVSKTCNGNTLCRAKRGGCATKLNGKTKQKRWKKQRANAVTPWRLAYLFLCEFTQIKIYFCEHMECSYYAICYVLYLPWIYILGHRLSWIYIQHYLYLII